MFRTEDRYQESNVIAGACERHELFRAAVTRLKPSDFVDHLHAALWKEMIDVGDSIQDGPTRAFLACKKLIESNKFEDVGRLVGRIIKEFPLGSNEYIFRHALKVVLSLSRQREINTLGERLQDCESIDDSYETLKEGFDRISTRVVAGDATPLVGDSYVTLLDELEANKVSPQLVATGWPGLDSFIGGFSPGELVVVAGPNGGGKSVFALNLATYAAKRNRGVLYVTLEMGERDIQRRMTANFADVNLTALYNSRYTSDDRKRIVEVSSQFSQLPMGIWDRSNITVDSIIERAEAYRQQMDLRMIVVDYLGLVSVQDKKASEYDRITSVARHLKIMARELNVIVVSPCQLNKEGLKKPTPSLDDLKSSGEIAASADFVFFLRMDDGDGVKPSAPIKLFVKKNRRGPEAMLTLQFDKPFQRIVEQGPVDWEYENG